MAGAIHRLEEARIKKGMRVIVRADLDVGVKNGRVVDDMRIRAGLPTIQYLLGHDARIRIVGYHGRPGGIRDPQLTLAPVSRLLAKLLKKKVAFLQDPFSERTIHTYRDSGDILFFENIRFWKEETDNDIRFARMIASWGDCYVNDAFANAHRREASLVLVPTLLPAYAGLRLAEEIDVLKRVVKNPRRPLVAVLGGAKIETKLSLIKKFLREADRVLVGGALANTLFASLGKGVGKSLAEKNMGKEAALLMKSRRLCLPSDVLVASILQAGEATHPRAPDRVEANDYIIDIGPMSAKLFAEIIGRAATVVWNGPMGFAEIPAFAKGTIAVARAMQKNKGFTVVGGGDTLAALAHYRLAKGFSYMSTGGGAMLEFLSGKKLPAIEALKK